MNLIGGYKPPTVVQQSRSDQLTLEKGLASCIQELLWLGVRFLASLSEPQN